MEQLIKITEHKGKNVVSARELHAFLGVKKDFSNWIKHRINKYGLIEKQDYVTLAQMGEADNQPLNKIEYALTIDAAKELAMVEGNEKGKQARQYFIKCEKLLVEVKAQLPDFHNPIVAARAWADQVEGRQLAEAKAILLNSTIEQQAPKVRYMEEVLATENAWPITVIASELGMSAVKLNQILAEKGVQRKISGTWVLSARYANQDFTKTKTHTYTDTKGESKSSILTVWTEKGRHFLHQLFNKNL